MDKLLSKFACPAGAGMGTLSDDDSDCEILSPAAVNQGEFLTKSVMAAPRPPFVLSARTGSHTFE